MGGDNKVKIMCREYNILYSREVAKKTKINILSNTLTVFRYRKRSSTIFFYLKLKTELFLFYLFINQTH